MSTTKSGGDLPLVRTTLGYAVSILVYEILFLLPGSTGCTHAPIVHSGSTVPLYTLVFEDASPSRSPSYTTCNASPRGAIRTKRVDWPSCQCCR